MNKITVIGAGSVGSTVAYTLAVTGIASEIVMIDINREKALGEALDIRQGIPFCSPCYIYAGDYRDAAGSDIVVLTSGIARKPGQSRLDLAQTNVDITKSIIPKIVAYAPEAVYVIVSNPVDILTYTFIRCSGLPAPHIIGSGTILDTARLRARLSEFYTINQQNVHAYVFGEHGDSSFIPWSLANISNVPVDEYRASLAKIEDAGAIDVACPVLDHAAVEDYVRKSGARVIQRKGATFYAVSIAVCHICRAILSGIDTTMTVSSLLDGDYGISGVCLSLINIIGKAGVHGKVLPQLTETEAAQLQKSAEALKGVISNIKI